MKNNALPTGKLDVKILRKMLRRYTKTDKKIIVGPRIGEDAAVIDMGKTALVVTTDPITFASDTAGYYSVMVNANDIATTGAKPKWYTVTILLPERSVTENQVDSIFKQIHDACEMLNISLIGGHTEITYGLDRPIIVGQMLGEIEKDKVINTGGAKAGDYILLTKGIAIEGTSIIAREKEADLLSHGISKDVIERAKGFLFDPGIGIVEEAQLAFQTGYVHAMHDVTEGGLANGLHEMAIASGVSIKIDEKNIPVFKESRIFCELFGLDLMGIISSGALLIAASPIGTDTILREAHLRGLQIIRIGSVDTDDPPSVTKVTSRGLEPVPFFGRDEIAKIF